MKVMMMIMMNLNGAYPSFHKFFFLLGSLVHTPSVRKKRQLSWELLLLSQSHFLVFHQSYCQSANELSAGDTKIIYNTFTTFTFLWFLLSFIYRHKRELPIIPVSSYNCIFVNYSGHFEHASPYNKWTGHTLCCPGTYG